MSFRGNPNVVNLTDYQDITGYKNFAGTGVNIAGKLTATNTTNDIKAADNQNNNYVVTTTAKNKAKNGYYKFGNGLIIQWCEFTYASGTGSVTITFPTPFTSTNYALAESILTTGREKLGHFESKTTTNVKFISGSYGGTGPAMLIAIGY